MKPIPWWGWILVVTCPVWIVPFLLFLLIYAFVSACAEFTCRLFRWRNPTWTLFRDLECDP